MSDKKANLALWQRVCVTDPKAVKPITGKQYAGNSPKPYWIVQRLTEEFGPCGIGWGYTVLNERMERLTGSEILHVALVRLWYVMEDKRGEVEQIGQTKALYAKRDGSLLVDEDAPKKSVTDALVKCASYLGFAGDIFSGRWDDSKYVEWAREHYADAKPAKSENVIPASFRSSPLTDENGRKAIELLEPEVQESLRDLAMEVVSVLAEQGGPAAFARIESENLDNEQRMGLWSILDSKTRTALKKAAQPAKEAA